MICPECGARGQETGRFCMRCGKPLEEAAAASRRPRYLWWLVGIVVLLAIGAGALGLFLALDLRDNTNAQSQDRAGTMAALPTGAEEMTQDREEIAEVTAPGPLLTGTVAPPLDQATDTATPMPPTTAHPFTATAPPSPELPTLTLTPPPTATPTATTTPSPSPTPKPRIAYVSEQAGSPQIWIVNADGTQQVQLTSLGHNGYPSWSADNRQILFASNRDGEWRVYSMNADGSDQRPLIERGGCVAPQSSVTGQLSYACLQDGNWEIYVEGRRITSNDTDDRLHVWSPLGERIAFEALRNDGQYRVLSVVDPDGSGLRPLTDAEHRSWNVAWSPDGRRLVFASDREGNARLFVIGVDGSALKALTRADQWSQAPAWSPNGRWISYVAGDGPVWTLYRIEPDGQNRIQLARYAHPGQTQSWAPDSQRLAFAGNADGDYEIYVVGSGGSGLKQLTRNGSDDHSPAWSR